MLQKPDQSLDQIKKLIKFSENTFQSVCERLSHTQQKAAILTQSYNDQTGKILDLLTCVAMNLKGHEFDV